MRAPRTIKTITTTAGAVLMAFLALLSTSTHTVGRGETLSAIASRHGISVRALQAANGISNPNRILVGDRLVIPAAAPPPTTSYTVRSGDTPGRIASLHGPSLSSLVSLPGTGNPNQEP